MIKLNILKNFMKRMKCDENLLNVATHKANLYIATVKS